MVKRKKGILYPVFFMVSITLIFTLSLSLLNELTIDRVKYNQTLNTRRTLVYIFNIATEASSGESFDEVYDRYIYEREIDGTKIYIAKTDDEVLGYAFPIQGYGLWGTIQGFAAISPDYSTLLGIDFTSHNETPGLGGRISDPDFKEQFRQLTLSDSRNEYIIYRPSVGGSVDAIAGATLTSESVRKILNKDIRNFISNRKGEQ